MALLRLFCSLFLFLFARCSVLVKQYDDAASILVAVVIVSTVAFAQELQSEQSIAALANLIPPTCACLRDGTVAKIEGSRTAARQILL